MSEVSTSSTASAAERARIGHPVANPRRLRIGRDGRPLPVPAREDEAQPA